mmetsp:Transcript_1382/g.1842  ORF Transcript_1382/g.1842 Transcript_1382/m.1842 type:complete len:137 (+) Transcript_1382:64-474(+)
MPSNPRGFGILKKLAEHGASAMQPRIIRGRWAKPIISRRKAADQRKKAVIEGTFGSFSIEHGGWDPKWDKCQRPITARPFKGHKQERNRTERVQKIEKNLESQNKLFLEAKKATFKEKPEENYEDLLKRLSKVGKR